MADIKPWQSALAQGINMLGPLLDQRRTLRRQAAATEQGLRDQLARQSQADARVMQELASLSRSTPDDERAAANEAFMLALQRARANAATPTVPGVSGRYTMDARLADQAAFNYGRRIADLMSRIDAPLLQRTREREGFARAGSDLRGIARDSEVDDWLMRLRLRTRQPNPWAPLLAALGGAMIEGLGGRSPVSSVDDGLTEIDLSTLPGPRTMPPRIHELLRPMPNFERRGL